MRKRYQHGSLGTARGRWIAQWWENGHRRKRTLGRVSEMTKSEADVELAEIVAPINRRQGYTSQTVQFKSFIQTVYLPLYKHKWKPSTFAANRDRVACHLTSVFGDRALSSLGREEFQGLLDAKSAIGLSYSVVAHLRWDLKQIFDLAVAEGCVTKNPALLLYVPRETRRPVKRVMTMEEVGQCLKVLDLRERLIMKFAVLAGMRPGEILGLQWGCLEAQCAQIRQRLYRGTMDSPKSPRSTRQAALPLEMEADIQSWREASINTSRDAWVFPSEALKTPISRDNLWRRHIRPPLDAIGMAWATFQVMRRTHASLMNELKVDPKVVADQLGHTLDVNQNVYTQVALNRRQHAVDTLASAIEHSLLEQMEHKASVN